ncbi:unnamed protein product [Lota lota]
MDDAYPYTLVVELEENNIPKLKNKLVKYFQSKKRANGGECQIQYEDRSRTATLCFRREEDRARVLSQETHEIVLEERVLKVSVHLADRSCERELTTTSNTKQSNSDEPAAEEEIQVEAASREEQTEEPALCSTSAVLENVSQDMSKEFMEMLVENICNNFKSPMTTQPEFSLEILSDICSAVVTFSSAKENNEFITSCQTNRMFLSKKLTVRPLEVTSQVKVDDVSNIKEDVLLLYFENEGWEVERVTTDEEEQSAVISFKMDTAVQWIIKKEHRIGRTPVKVFPFYDSLGTALYGKDRPTPKLPAAFSKSIHPTILTYLHRKQEAAEMIRGHLSPLFCKVDLLPSSVSFSPLPTLLEQKDVKAKDIKQWKRSVEQAFTQVLSRFKTLRLQPPPSAWEESEVQIREIVLNKTVEVIPDKDEGALSVVGFVDDVTRLEPTFKDLLSRIEKRVLRKNSSITQGFEISKEMFHLLCQDGLADQFKNKYPELEITYEDKLILKGLSHEVSDAACVVMAEVLAVQQKLFDGREADEEIQVEAASRQEQTEEPALCSTSAVLENVPQDMSKEFMEMLVQNICKNFKSPMTTQPEFSLEILSDICSAVVTFSSAKENNEFITSCQTNRMFLSKKLTVRPLEVTSQVKVEDLSNINEEVLLLYFENEGWEVERVTPDEEEQSAVISFKMDTDVQGIIKKKHLIGKTLLKVFPFYNSLGAALYGKERPTLNVSKLMRNTRKNDQPLSRPIYQIQTSDGIDIAVCKADLCSYPVDAVVINSNKNLELDGGGGAFVAAAGSCLQEECDQILLRRGQLKPGDCVITGAGGRLHCKKVIHAVTPQYDPSNLQRTVGQLRRAVKGSLELAEMNGCQSLAISAISANMGFPLNLCADTIIKVMNEHFEDQFGENTLKQIHLVSTDDRTVQALEKAVRDKFGNQGRIGSQQSVPDKQSIQSMEGYIEDNRSVPEQLLKSPHLGQETNSLQLLDTSGKLSIELVEGNIQDATTEGIVNVVGKELDLGRGVISKAILDAAGPDLQMLVNEQRKSGNFGDVIVTGTCKLRGNMLFHAVVPHWDKQGNAYKIMRGIVEDCLNKAENHGLTSITFPAIGTGNLGFPKDLAASGMIEEVLKFKKQSMGLKKVVIVLHPKDRETIQRDLINSCENTNNASNGGRQSKVQRATTYFSPKYELSSELDD